MARHSYTEIGRCRICGSSDLIPILSLGQMALTGVFPRSADEPVTTGPVGLVKCDEARPGACGLVQLRQTYRFEEMYGDNYGYRSGLNASMVSHLTRKVSHIASLASLQPGDLVIDIGSNDGTLLGAYDRVGHPRTDRLGIDPTAEKFRHYYAPGIQVAAEFFSPRAVERAVGARAAKVVTSIAMLYDLESPLEFVAQVRQVLADDGVWVFEQSYLPTMLDRLAYDTICHEHLEFYALAQIKWLTDRSGLKIVDVELNDVNGGSFSVVAAKREAPYPEATERVAALLADERARGLHQRAPYQNFEVGVLGHRVQLRNFVHGVRQAGKRIYGYGASTKGNVLLQYCDFTLEDIPAIADVNEDKFGRLTPGTHIPIISEARAHAERPDYFLVLPWHFKAGFIAREAPYLQRGGVLVFPLPELTLIEQRP